MYTFYVIQCRLSLSLIFIFSLLFSVRRSTPLSFIVHYVSCFLVVIPFLPLELLTLYFSVGKVAQNFTDLKLKRLFYRGKNGPEFIQQWHLRWHFIWAMAFAAFGITNTLLKMGKSKVIKSGKKTISNTIFNCNRRYASTHSRLVARSQSVPPQFRRSKKFSQRNMIQLNRAIPGWCAGSCSTINLFYSW